MRKWLVYFTLFISAITIIVDLMIFVYNFLDGELTVKFFLIQDLQTLQIQIVDYWSKKKVLPPALNS